MGLSHSGGAYWIKEEISPPLLCILVLNISISINILYFGFYNVVNRLKLPASGMDRIQM